MTERASCEIPFVTPDLGPVEAVEQDAVEAALHALARYRSVLLNGSLDCAVDARILDEEETLIATYGDENVSTYLTDDDLIVAIGHRHGTEHLIIDIDLIRSLGIMDVGDDPRIHVLRMIDFGTSVIERAGDDGITAPGTPDALQDASDLACALGLPSTIVIENSVGTDAEDPLLRGSHEGPDAGGLSDATAREPFATVLVEGGDFGHEIRIGRLTRTIHPRPMDAVERMRVIAESAERGITA